MKLRSLFFIFIMLFSMSFIHAQEVSFSIISSSDREITIRVDFPEMDFSVVDVEGVPMNIININGAYPVEVAGAPAALKSAQSIIIPDGTTPVIEVINSYGDTFSNFELAPSKGKLYRDVDPSAIPYIKGDQYSEDAFYPLNIAELSDPYIFRDFHGVTVSCHPFTYNPVTKTLIKQNYIEIRISFQGTAAETTEKNVVKEFAPIYSSHFLNYSATQTRYSIMEEDGDMLIITPTNLMPALESFKNWKIKNGINTEIVELSNIGTTSAAIKSFIQTKYQENSNLTYVLLVGDNSNMPPYSYQGALQDNMYVEVAGSDNYPDLFLGRISATTLEHVTTQVEKAIIYESNPPETSHFPVYCGIASLEGTGDMGEYDYQHIRNIGNKLQNFTYTSGVEFFEGSQGGMDAPGNPSATQVAGGINSGVGIINYTGHGSTNSWVTSGFNNANVDALTNYNKLPFIISVACVNGEYNLDCFAEHWLRAKKPDGYTGAVATVMSTINQPWNPPMRAQDEMNDIITETASNGNVKRSFGGICFNGFLKMLDVYNDFETYRTWLIFGDPSLMIRTAVPDELTATHLDVVVMGLNSVTVSSPVEGAKIVLTHQNTILDKGIIEDGSVTLSIPLLSVGDTIHVLGSKFNYIPYQGTMIVISSDGAYLVTEDHVVKDQSGNIINEIIFGESFSLAPSIKNYGNGTANNVTVTLDIDDEYITVNNTSVQVNSISGGSTIIPTQGFTFDVSPLTPNLHQTNFTININYNSTDGVAYSSYITTYAPILSPRSYTIDDSNSGDKANQRLDVGETAIISFQLDNEGLAKSKTGTATLQSLDGFITVNENNISVSPINPDGTGVTDFSITVNSNCIAAAYANIKLTYNFDGLIVEEYYVLPVSQPIEDWESGDMNKFNWDTTALFSWVLTTENVYEGRYSARSRAIQNSSESMLSVTSYALEDDSIYFYYYLSSEEDKDFLEFYIDHSLKGRWSGEIGWTYASFPVSQGTHTFGWKYKKNYINAGGDDLAMIDYIRFPISEKIGLSVIEADNGFNVNIYPNPVQDKFTIRTHNYSYENGRVMLYDVNGRLIMSQPLQNPTEEINTKELSSGIYFVKVMEGQVELKNLKLIKQ